MTKNNRNFKLDYQEVICFLYSIKNNLIELSNEAYEIYELLQQKIFVLSKQEMANFKKIKNQFLIKLKNIDIKKLKNFPVEIIQEYFCVKVFNDSFKNVFSNLETFHKAYENKLLKNREEFKILETIYNLLNSRKEILLSVNYNEFLEAKEKLYDAFKAMQEISFTQIKDSLYNLDEKDYDQELSQKYGTKIYKIGKENKKMLLQVTRFSKSFPDKYEDYFSSQKKRSYGRKYISLSYVENQNIKTYRNVNEFVTLLYGSNIPQDSLIAITNKDAYTSYERPNKEIKALLDDQVVEAVAIQQNSLYTSSEELLKRTDAFNEVSIIKKDIFNEQEESANLPIAVFCNGEITAADINFAKAHNLPIVLSESKYSYKSGSDNEQKRKVCFDNFDNLEL